MPRKKLDEMGIDDRGRFRSKVGYKVNEKGERTPYPFYFGAEKASALARRIRVSELWAHVVKLSQQPKLF